MRKVITVVLIAVLSIAAFAQQPKTEKVTPKAPYDSLMVQLAFERQKNMQLELDNAFRAYQNYAKEMQDNYNRQQLLIDAWKAEVIKANGWKADEYSYDPAKDEWTHTEKIEAKKDAPK